MASSRRRLELNCIICSQPLTSMQISLPEDVLQIVAEQNITLNRKTDLDYNNHVDLDQYQVIATKCGHMFHMGCLRGHIKSYVERVGPAPCPICSKPVTLTRIWPVLIPPTPAQLSKMKKLHFMKTQNTELKVCLSEIRKKVKANEIELKTIEEETENCLSDIHVKQQRLDDMNGPSEAELEELRRIHKNRQSIVRVVTKHNADLLGVLMHETNVQVSDAEFTISDQDLAEVNNNLQQKERDLDRVYEGSYLNRRNPSRGKNKENHQRRERSRHREKYVKNLKAPLEENSSNSDSDSLQRAESSASYSPNNTKPFTPFDPSYQRHHYPERIRNQHQQQNWRPSSQEKFVNATSSEMRSLAMNKITKAGGGMGPYTRQAVERTLGRIGQLPVRGSGGGRGLVLTRKNGTRAIVKEDNAGEGVGSSSLRLVPWTLGANRSKPPVPSKNSSRTKVRPYRPKWCT